MRNFIFLWRDENGNNAYEIIEAGSLPRAHDTFCAQHAAEYYAVFEGFNIEVREFFA